MRSNSAVTPSTAAVPPNAAGTIQRLPGGENSSDSRVTPISQAAAFQRSVQDTSLPAAPSAAM